MNLSRLAAVCTGLILQAAASGAQAADPPGVNPAHYRCYKVSEGSQFQPLGVKLKDQFGANEAKVLRPQLLCAPVSKNGAAVKDPRTHLVCFDQEGGNAPEAKVMVQNQFGKQELRVASPVTLCVPSLKTVLH